MQLVFGASKATDVARPNRTRNTDKLVIVVSRAATRCGVPRPVAPGVFFCKEGSFGGPRQFNGPRDRLQTPLCRRAHLLWLLRDRSDNLQ